MQLHYTGYIWLFRTLVHRNNSGLHGSPRGADNSYEVWIVRIHGTRRGRGQCIPITQC